MRAYDDGQSQAERARVAPGQTVDLKFEPLAAVCGVFRGLGDWSPQLFRVRLSSADHFFTIHEDFKVSPESWCIRGLVAGLAQASLIYNGRRVERALHLRPGETADFSVNAEEAERLMGPIE